MFLTCFNRWPPSSAANKMRPSGGPPKSQQRQLGKSATMYWEAGSCCCVYLNWNAHIQYTHHSLVERGVVQVFVPSSKSWASPRTRLSTCKCMLENWLSLGSDNGKIEVDTDAKRCVEDVSKNFSSKLVTKYHVQIWEHNTCMLYKIWVITRRCNNLRGTQQEVHT